MPQTRTELTALLTIQQAVVADDQARIDSDRRIIAADLVLMASRQANLDSDLEDLAADQALVDQTLAQIAALPPDLPVLVVAYFVPNDDSAKIYITPVPGAVDYRVYDRDNPHFVKYAGGAGGAALKLIPRFVNGKYLYDERSLPCIEFNGLEAGKSAALIVEAVDRLGPYMDMFGEPMPPCTEQGCGGVLDPLCTDTQSANGHGVVGDFPLPIARGEVTVLSAPRSLGGEQAFFDTFADPATFARIARDPAIPYVHPVVQFDSTKWTALLYNSIDRMDEVKIFTDHKHLMTVLPDGGKGFWDDPKTPINEHIFVGGVAYSSIGLRPKASADISGGKVLHVTGEWDAHNSDRRWQDVFIMPKGDALLENAWRELLLNPTLSTNSIVVDIGNGLVRTVQWDAAAKAGWKDDRGVLRQNRMAGASPTENWRPCWRVAAGNDNPSQAGYTGWANGHDNDIDNRHRFDIYLSQTRVKVYEEGTLKVDWMLPVPLAYTQFDVVFADHLYHSSLEHAEIRDSFVEKEPLWLKRTPYIDQRHWDNLGFEVLPAMP